MEPAHNRDYKTHSYWENRFTQEKEYEWLVPYSVVRPHFLSFKEELAKGKVLVVGCGNSNFSSDLCGDLGVNEILSIDFSDTVIEAMRKKYPHLGWRTMDMTSMEFDDSIFDFVIDKAAMDTLVTDEGDPWCPNEETVESTTKYVNEVVRVLKPNGTLIQISFQQPHFRKKYLLHKDLTTPEARNIDYGLGYFMYVQHKHQGLGS